MKNSYLKKPALFIAVIAMYSALVSAGKIALAVLPNIEIVTILLGTCAFVWGVSVAVPVAVVYSLVQIPIYGFGVWVLQYLVYWPVVALVFAFLGKFKYKNTVVKVVIMVAIAVVLTFIFGVFTSAVDTFMAYTSQGGFRFVLNDYWYRFGIVYTSGIVFYLLQIVCNLATFTLLFLPLEKVNRKAKMRLFEC